MTTGGPAAGVRGPAAGGRVTTGLTPPGLGICGLGTPAAGVSLADVRRRFAAVFAVLAAARGVFSRALFLAEFDVLRLAGFFGSRP